MFCHLQLRLVPRIITAPRPGLRLSSSFSANQKASKFIPVLVFTGAVTAFSVYLFFPDQSRGARTSSSAPMSLAHFTPVKVTSNESCGPATKLLELTVAPHLVKHKFSPIWSVYIKDDDIQVERPYTPLEGVDDRGKMKFWIKKYEHGEVGRWLHSKRVGDTIELRGPSETWKWEDGVWDDVIMISGGTGITPFCQLFCSVIQNQPPDCKTRFTLLHSSKTAADIPPTAVLGPLQRYAENNLDRLRVNLFVDTLVPVVNGEQQVMEVGRINKSAIQKALDRENSSSWRRRLLGSLKIPSEQTDKKVLFLICGPDPMISAIAGPFGRNKTQGSVGGILGDMGYTSEQVWKL